MIAALYRLATAAAEPLAPLLLRLRLRHGKEEKERLAERLGKGGGTRPPGRLVWLHAASIGESVSTLPLIGRIVSSGDCSVLVTTGTTTSAAIMARRLPENCFHRYAPLDGPRAVRRFLDRWQPDAALWVESELWPNLLLETRRRRIPSALVNGRMSPRSFRRWRRLPSLARILVRGFDVVLARTEADAARFEALGAAAVTVAGDLKAAAGALHADDAALAGLAAAIAVRPAWLAASTHEGEERMAADAHRQMAGDVPGLLTVIVPRHAARGDAIETELTDRGHRVARRSRNELPEPGTDIFLGDTMGEMGLYLRLANPVLVGKSMLHEGGHNPLEPALLGRAVLFGPHMENFTEAAGNLMAAGGAIQVADPQALAAVASRLLCNPEAARQIGECGRTRAEADAAGILDAACEALAPVLGGSV